jgi:hypothetical protein
MWIDKNFLEDPCNSCLDPEPECEKCNKWNEAYDKYFEDWIERNRNISNRDQVKELRYISYKKDPLGFLLLLCDLLQDWGRHDFKDLGQAFKIEYSPWQLAGIEYDGSKITFDIEIKTHSDPDSRKLLDKFLKYKKKENVKVFSRLRFIDNHNIVIRLRSTLMDPIEFSLNDFRRQRKEHCNKAMA